MSYRPVHTTNQGALFIRSDSIYDDTVSYSSDQYSHQVPTTTVKYEGQNYGREDRRLISLVQRGKPIHVFVRKLGENKSYKYMGVSTAAYIVRHRTVDAGVPTEPHQRLCIHVVLSQCQHIDVPHDTVFAKRHPKSAKYKHDSLAMLGVRSYGTGAASAHGSAACRNLAIGYFCW